jgi:hypothetical protein
VVINPDSDRPKEFLQAKIAKRKWIEFFNI